MNQPASPFTCTHSPNLPELLYDLNCTIAISTYQAGKVIFISSKDRENLVQLPRNFNKPMGMAIDGKKMAIATQYEVIELIDAPQMAAHFPKKKNTYDGLFLPRVTYHTGSLDIHDLEWINNDLIAINTQFSCICKVSSSYSFESLWQPEFIKKLNPTDDCHLNGIATENGQLKYVSALGSTNTPEGWRANKLDGGIIIDVESNEIICQKLAMPHSPRIYNGQLLALLSATGEIIKIEPDTGKYETIKKLDGFVRGMTRLGDYLFVGLSKLRTKTSAFGDLPIAQQSVSCGIDIIHMPTMGIVSALRYENSVEEIYDVKVLAGKRRPAILNTEKEDHRSAITSPIGDFWATKKASV